LIGQQVAALIQEGRAGDTPFGQRFGLRIDMLTDKRAGQHIW
jgi:hypothetical protein